MEKHKNTALSNEERVEDLLSHMTLEQKVSQLQCIMLTTEPVQALQRFPDGIGEATVFGGGGQTVEENADFVNTVQDTVIGKNDLEIPTLFHAEAVTGLNAVGATIFPSAIGLGATFQPDTVERMADIIRKQMLAVGVRQALSPVMDVARDPRWGRVGETYGEDPTLCAVMSVAFTKGLQGDDLKEGVVATGKHFLGYSYGEGGLNMASNPIPPRELREVYAKPFQAAISEAGLQSVMNSYGTIDGELVIKSKHILTEMLRDEMGFDGLLVSDYMSINRAVDLKVSQNPKSGGIEALQAGLDSELPTPYGFTNALIEGVHEGLIDDEIINRSVRRVMMAKVALGLFENPYARTDLIEEAYNQEFTRSQSLKAAKESIVLLKNDGILPLQKDIKKITVIGPHGDSIRMLFGCYTYPATIEMILGGAATEMAGLMADDTELAAGASPFLEGSNVREKSPLVTETIQQLYGGTTPTILASIQAKCPNAEVVYVRGAEVAGTNRSGFEAAVAAAKEADVVILTVGGKYGWGSNCTIGEGVDSDHIGLPGVQEDLARAICETGTPAVLVHMDAKPLSSEYITEHFPAIIENWFPGITGGQAIADVLFGDYNPAGRLPMTAARNTGQIPIYASHRVGNSYTPVKGMVLAKYAEGSKRPLFTFGEGKSYTEFSYSNLTLDKKKVKADGIIRLSFEVTNIGERDGEEVVQVYVSDDLSSVVRPVKELAGFQRIAIAAGEKKLVAFSLRADQFAFLDSKMDWIVEAGTMTVTVGGSSEDIRLSDTFEIENTAYIVGKDRGFYAKPIA
ncbi:glycoside hydrolase family 3 N-terminal domain-containing protein [Paenibacillus antibioticophila]|uniref:glycoside hydrolase family 3 N-terminal domain-containing protein n=1 Tax=Paenibacillus antibioticophila TaxID=1274374 RepID=UPI000B0E716C|nr:glycoside hydrolase family 3 N-terminal domain-containing protein [Paenibacillus antibioticophila]